MSHTSHFSLELHIGGALRRLPVLCKHVRKFLWGMYSVVKFWITDGHRAQSVFIPNGAPPSDPKMVLVAGHKDSCSLTSLLIFDVNQPSSCWLLWLTENAVSLQTLPGRSRSPLWAVTHRTLCPLMFDLSYGGPWISHIF